MKPFWLAVAFLVGVGACAIINTRALKKTTSKITDYIDLALASALAGDFEGAKPYTEAAQQNWERYSHYFSSVAPHEHLDPISDSFAELEVYEAASDSTEFIRCCVMLREQVSHVYEMERLVYYNLFVKPFDPGWGQWITGFLT